MKPLAPWLLGAALLPSPTVLPAQTEAPPASAFAPPGGPLLLTRTVRRPLSDGKAIVVRRRYEVRIAALGRGYRVEGRLLDCTVEAPPSLQALAAIERDRPDTGLFPMTLDAQGQILSPAKAGPSPALDAAARAALDKLGSWPLAPLALAQGRAFVQQLQARGTGSAWPAEVFHPTPGRHVERRAIPLADGSSGSVSVEIEAAPPSPGTLSSLSRAVITELAGERRVAREEWTLAPLP